MVFASRENSGKSGFETRGLKDSLAHYRESLSNDSGGVGSANDLFRKFVEESMSKLRPQSVDNNNWSKRICRDR